jgi:hypothetical protein
VKPVKWQSSAMVTGNRPVTDQWSSLIVSSRIVFARFAEI